MRQQLSLFALAVLSMAGLASCRQDMHDQPKYEAYEGSDFFADSSANRVAIDGTVARGFLNEDEALYGAPSQGGDTTKAKTYLTSFPYPVSAAMIDRGEERYNVYCAPCHARTGNGDGMVVRRGYRKPPSLHQERLRTAEVGYFYDVITNGFGVMPSYADQVPVRDRWAIISYIRALQLSQNASIADLPADKRAMVDGGAGASTAAASSVNPTGASSVSEPTGGTSPAAGSAAQSTSGNTQSGGQGK